MSVCKRCNIEFTPKGGAKGIFCSQQCRCASIAEAALRVCQYCGKTFKPKCSTRKTFCGRECSFAHLRENGRPERRTVAHQCTNVRPCRICKRLTRSLVCLSVECRKEDARRIAQAAYVRLTRRAAKKGCERFHPNEIFERDGWRCQLCMKPVDRKAAPRTNRSPTMDHIVPVSKGGMHTRENVQCAHFICNSYRGANGYAQARLFG